MNVKIVGFNINVTGPEENIAGSDTRPRHFDLKT